MNTTKAPSDWYLEGFADDGREIWRTAISKLPFRVGRRIDLELVLPARRVSLKHASLYLRQGTLWLRDLGSTNGTFLNGERIPTDQPLENGDVIHFADQEFRLIARQQRLLTLATQTMSLTDFDFQSQLFEQQRRLREMLADNSFLASFQPLVRLADEAVIGYELLGRGRHESGEMLPGEIFSVAETLGLENELSVALRHKGLEEATQLPSDAAVFFNTHPRELSEEKPLLKSLERLRSAHPSRELVLEVHEAAAADLKALQALRISLDGLDIGLAFDDFGTGQTRLLELIDVAPRFVKFDRTWIRGLQRATSKRRELIDTLVGLLAAMDVSTIAEGIETVEEAAACRELGFEHAQGYHFGRPAAADSFIS